MHLSETSNTKRSSHLSSPSSKEKNGRRRKHSKTSSSTDKKNETKKIPPRNTQVEYSYDERLDCRDDRPGMPQIKNKTLNSTTPSQQVSVDVR